MLTFLRKVRKSLIDSSGTRKYLLYALGEIVLVVIGILIALSINNWNEWRKERVLEIKILKSLEGNIERNIANLNSSISRNDKRNWSSRLVLNLIENKLPYVDTLDKHFFSGILVTKLDDTPARDGYEAFKNVGFDIILNDSLRKSIILLFDEEYIKLEEWGHYSSTFAPDMGSLWSKYFKRTNTKLKPLDYQELLESNEIANAYELSKGFNSVYLTRLYRSLGQSKEVLQSIKEELGD